MRKRYFALSMCMVIIILGSNLVTYSIGKNEVVGEIANFKVMIEGNEFTSQNPVVLMNDITYLPLKDVGRALGVKVNWNVDKRQVEIDQKNIAKVIKPLRDNNGLEVSYIDPENDSQNIYLKWGFMQIVFNEPIQRLKDTNKIYIIDEFGNRVKIKSGNPGLTKKNIMILIPEQELNLDTKYKLYIPKDTIYTEKGHPYGVELSHEFKTASNVVKGDIKSNTDYYGSKIVLENTLESYEVNILDNNQFFFTNIPMGKYDLILKYSGQQPIQSEIVVKNNEINNFSIR